jgi:hypothetical protein
MSRRQSFMTHAMAQPGAAVVAHEEETLIAEVVHDLEHVLGHDAEA